MLFDTVFVTHTVVVVTNGVGDAANAAGDAANAVFFYFFSRLATFSDSQQRPTTTVTSLSKYHNVANCDEYRR